MVLQVDQSLEVGDPGGRYDLGQLVFFNPLTTGGMNPAFLKGIWAVPHSPSKSLFPLGILGRDASGATQDQLGAKLYPSRLHSQQNWANVDLEIELIQATPGSSVERLGPKYSRAKIMDET